MFHEVLLLSVVVATISHASASPLAQAVPRVKRQELTLQQSLQNLRYTQQQQSEIQRGFHRYQSSGPTFHQGSRPSRDFDQEYDPNFSFTEEQNRPNRGPSGTGGNGQGFGTFDGPGLGNGNQQSSGGLNNQGRPGSGSNSQNVDPFIGPGFGSGNQQGSGGLNNQQGPGSGGFNQGFDPFSSSASANGNQQGFVGSNNQLGMGGGNSASVNQGTGGGSSGNRDQQQGSSGGNQVQGVGQPWTTQRTPANVLFNENTIPEVQCIRQCPSVSNYDPICGSDNITYTNRGKFRCAQQCGRRVNEVYPGSCVTTPRPN